MPDLTSEHVNVLSYRFLEIGEFELERFSVSVVFTRAAGLPLHSELLYEYQVIYVIYSLFA